jgi:hypothetical protein
MKRGVRFVRMLILLVLSSTVFIVCGCGGGGDSAGKDCSNHAASIEECRQCLGAVDRGSYYELTECGGATEFNFSVGKTCECH